MEFINLIKESFNYIFLNVILKILQVTMFIVLPFYLVSSQVLSNFYVCLAALQLMATISGFGIGEEINNKKRVDCSLEDLKIKIHNSWIRSYRFTLLIIVLNLIYGIYFDIWKEILIFSIIGTIISYTKNLSLAYQKFGNIKFTTLWGNGFSTFVYLLLVVFLLATQNVFFSGLCALLISFFSIIFYIFSIHGKTVEESISFNNYDYLIISFLAWLLNLGFTFVMKFYSSPMEINKYVIAMQFLGAFIFLPTSLFQAMNSRLNSSEDISENKMRNISFNSLVFVILFTIIVGNFLFNRIDLNYFSGINFENFQSAFVCAGLIAISMTGYYSILLVIYQRGSSNVLRNVVLLVDTFSFFLSVYLLKEFNITIVLFCMSLSYFLKVLLLNFKNNVSLSYFWVISYISSFLISLKLIL